MTIVFRFVGFLFVSLFLFIAFAFACVNLFFDSPLLSDYLAWLLVANGFCIVVVSYITHLHEQRDSEYALNRLIAKFGKTTLPH